MSIHHKSILITGATGFLGTALTDRLVKDGKAVTCLYRDVVVGSPFWEMQSTWGRFNKVQGDVLDLPLLDRVIAEYEIDLVFHLAAQTQVGIGSKDPMGTFKTNMMGTLNVLEACRRQKVEKVVVASTDKVYGSTQTPYLESNPLAERTPYGASKVCADVLAETYRNTYGLCVSTTRCGNLYGPGHMTWSTLIPATIKRIHEGERPFLRCGGKAVRDFLYVSDAVNAYLAVAESYTCAPYNFSGGDPRTILEVVNLILEKMQSDLSPIVVDDGEGEIQSQSLDCTRAKDILGWRPLVDFDSGLTDTVAWYREYFKMFAHKA